MKRIKVFVLSALVALFSIAAGSAFASPGDDGCVGNCGGGGGSATQGQSQGQLQGQAQLQGQSQAINSRISNDVRANANAFAAAQAKSSSNSAAVNLTATDVKTGGNVLSNGGNTLTVNEAPIPAVTRTEIQQNDYTIKNVPAFALGNVYPTTSCAHSSQVGGSGVGFSFGAGTSWIDDECSFRETARSFASFGLKEDAIEVLCSSKYAAAAPSCKAIAARNTPTTQKTE